MGYIDSMKRAILFSFVPFHFASSVDSARTARAWYDLVQRKAFTLCSTHPQSFPIAPFSHPPSLPYSPSFPLLPVLQPTSSPSPLCASDRALLRRNYRAPPLPAGEHFPLPRGLRRLAVRRCWIWWRISRDSRCWSWRTIWRAWSRWMRRWWFVSKMAGRRRACTCSLRRRGQRACSGSGGGWERVRQLRMPF